MLLSVLAVATGAAQDTPDTAHFTFSRFSVPGAVDLGIESIDNGGTISGYFTDSAGDYKGFVRSSSGTVTTVVDPGATSSPSITELGQIDTSGIAAGEFYDPATSVYSGFFYNSTKGTYRTYNVPGQPANTDTSVNGINKDATHFCGAVESPPYSMENAFIGIAGKVDIFSVEGSSETVCTALNNSDSAVGFYVDSTGVVHGWLRSSSGDITTIDEPDASTVTGSAPCGGTAGGTTVVGINNDGTISGHFWDSSFNEHGFYRTADGKYHEVNVPKAYQSSGGGMNDHGVMVGHYVNSSCKSFGYIATPQ